LYGGAVLIHDRGCGVKDIVFNISLLAKQSDLRANIINTATDLIGEFLYYGRKEDEELDVGDIEKAIIRGVVTVDEIIGIFRDIIDSSVHTEKMKDRADEFGK
jgi:hypothetical protein